jgi:hypothetical protein
MRQTQSNYLNMAGAVLYNILHARRIHDLKGRHAAQTKTEE